MWFSQGKLAPFSHMQYTPLPAPPPPPIKKQHPSADTDRQTYADKLGSLSDEWHSLWLSIFVEKVGTGIWKKTLQYIRSKECFELINSNIVVEIVQGT
jgi:hypothetical protein